MAWKHRQRPNAVNKRSILIYGAGYRCTLYLREIGLLPQETQEGLHIIGLLDDDRNVHGRLVHGYRVLGGIDSLESVLEDARPGEIVVTARLTKRVQERLMKVTRSLAIPVNEWHTELRPFTTPS